MSRYDADSPCEQCGGAAECTCTLPDYYDVVETLGGYVLDDKGIGVVYRKSTPMEHARARQIKIDNDLAIMRREYRQL